MLGIVVSRADSASVHIGERILEAADWTATEDDSRPDADGGGTVHRLPDAELRTFEEWHLHLDDAEAAFTDPDLLVFASRHAGETGPLLTAHHTGNFGRAEHGGADRSFARAAPNAHERVLAAFREYAPEGYDVGMECTHHGPTGVETPSLFVELGSDEAQWTDPAGARAVARAVLDLRGTAPDRERTLVGFGGGHYAPRFERVVRETDWAVGHLGADWSLADLGPAKAHADVVDAVFERSGATRALVEGDHPHLVDVVTDLGYDLVSETWARETTGVPLDLVARLEREVATVEEGLRFGERTAEGAALETVALPEALLAEANGIDREGVLAAVRDRTAAVTTEENGTRLAERVVVPAGEREAVVEVLVGTLREKYDEVRRDGGAVVAREVAFDPALAREAGVPEGPAFGRLAEGRSVEVDGETVAPAAVSRERERRFPFPAASDGRQTNGER
ncbi:D-aminoacyl-tRNA deacylase [Halomarina ordinaria]|uniref:D-aminoacyl-tRNA deacylase n=1 Tax=Halomarina ordinaria TaxID=3033939 RepID=A0ABD5UCF3_9EURY|nr:D-aminoacyl-tRNA deacylase [Halomarina sp. PSRA2]